MSPIVSYHLHKAPIQLETLRVVQYLYSRGVDIRPAAIIERNHSKQAAELPSIHDVTDNEWHVGLDACMRFYEKKSGIREVDSLATEFQKNNPGFRIQSL